ncbi:MAG: hypothetical protein ABI947_26665 [Chloroflexota bacterium]
MALPSIFADHLPDNTANALYTQTESLCQLGCRFAIGVALVDFGISEVSIDWEG